MKRIFVVIVSLLALAAAASAQPRAFGLRLGGDVEGSYQHQLGRNFMEADLGLGFGKSSLQLTGVYDFVIANTNNFSFYAGPGVQLNTWKDSERNTKFGVGIGGQLGFEYAFGSIPFNIALDWRPMWNFIGAYASWSSVALSFRYRF